MPSMSWHGAPAPEDPVAAKVIFKISITLVTVTLFARCFPKIFNVFVSIFTWCKSILHSFLDRALGILLLKLILS